MIRPFILPLALIGVMGSIFLLPRAGSLADSAISTKLPDILGEWHYNRIPPTEKELTALAKDTQFSKAVCLALNPGVYTANGNPGIKRIDLSVVVSGEDINNSIHRPERCMPAQGHQIYESRTDEIVTATGKKFPARLLFSMQSVIDETTKKETARHCATLYFFVGQHTITDDHLRRTATAMWDRITRGQDQRWAYVSASRWFSDGDDTNLPNRESAEKEIRQFLGDLADRNIDWKNISQQ